MKIALQGIPKDMMFDSKHEGTEVSSLSFLMKIFGIQKKKK